jgi:hypothetical protein
MSTHMAWRARCWGGPLDGLEVLVPCRTDGMPQGWVRIDQLDVDWAHVTKVPHDHILRAENDTGFYMHDDSDPGHPSGPLTYRWHDMCVALYADTSSEGGM